MGCSFVVSKLPVLLSVFVDLELCALEEWKVGKKVRRFFSRLVINVVVLFLSRVVSCG